ncbi:hypothetical protein PMI08_02150 [Brevibacillus sp. CF112]|uniref:hypothetical protein n=1 Tax=Brevibacillus TaxID=55080 RepID=UPI000271BB8D|nr:hypothetical protein [Brevibacillus sp. CF112]EJL44032.1 hypothetical protein PMI08_02150 [Brevibacillus sp. CF112]
MEDILLLPDFEAPKGLIKIEFFDALTQKKIEELNTRNFIAKGVREYVFKAKMRDVFTADRVTTGGYVSSAFRDHFETLTLTTADHPESPNTEWVRKGKVIGYAYTTGTYSGSDVLRGSYNAAESFTTPEQVHIVCDFPTHAANGTFSSIYFHPFGASVQKTSYFYRPFLKDVKSVKKHNNRYYVLKSPSTLEIYSSNWSLLQSYDLNDYNIYDFEIVQDTIYYTRVLNTKAIQKANLENPLQMELVLEKLPGSRRVAGIAYLPDKQQFAVSSSSSGISSPITLSYFNRNFEVLKDVELGFGYGYNYGALFYEDGVLFCNTQAIDENLYNSNISYNGVDSGNTILGVLDDSFVVVGGYRFPKTCIGSRALLESPVTKTSNVTMKITYDFMLPPLFV